MDNIAVNEALMVSGISEVKYTLKGEEVTLLDMIFEKTVTKKPSMVVKKGL